VSGPPRRTRPRAALTAIALALALAVAACGGTRDGETAAGTGEAVPLARTDGAAASGPALPVTLTDAVGREVTVESAARIIALNGNIAEVVFSLGLGDRVVGRDISTTFPEAEDLPLVTRAHDVSAESVLSLRPTVVLADTDSGPPEALAQIRDVGVPVVVFDVPTEVADIDPRIRAIARALGVGPAGDRLADEVTAEIEAVTSELADRGDRPRVAFLYLRGQAGVYLLGGPGSGADSMIEAAGGEDAGTAIELDRAFTPITSEALVRAAPEVILMTTTGLESVGGLAGLAEIPGIAQTPAGRDGRVATIEDGLLYSFGGRTPAALRHLAEQLRP
jgi:iron complex transport system substrate-binding protein